MRLSDFTKNLLKLCQESIKENQDGLAELRNDIARLRMEFTTHKESVSAKILLGIISGAVAVVSAIVGAVGLILSNWKE